MIRLFWAILFSLFPLISHAQGVRLKDLTHFEGVRGNDLVGYGLVVGLDGTGDGLRNAPFTEDMMSNILERLGVNVTGEQFRAKNVAAVIVTGSVAAVMDCGSTAHFPTKQPPPETCPRSIFPSERATSRNI